MAGLTVLLLVGIAAALPFADLSCSARQPMGSQTEAMELRGRWLGMELAATGTPSATNVGVPPQATGVVVMQVTPQGAPRAARAGLAAGDVIVRVDGTPVTTLAELYTLSTKLDVARPFPIDISRRGQALSLTLPAPTGMPTVPGAPSVAMMPGAPPVALPTTMNPNVAPPAQPVSPGVFQNPGPVAQSGALQAPMTPLPNNATGTPGAW